MGNDLCEDSAKAERPTEPKSVFTEISNFISGQKTNIIGGVVVGLGVAYALGYIPADRLKELLVILNGAGLLTIRSAIKKGR